MIGTVTARDSSSSSSSSSNNSNTSALEMKVTGTHVDLGNAQTFVILFPEILGVRTCRARGQSCRALGLQALLLLWTPSWLPEGLLLSNGSYIMGL